MEQEFCVEALEGVAAHLRVGDVDGAKSALKAALLHAFKANSLMMPWWKRPARGTDVFSQAL